MTIRWVRGGVILFFLLFIVAVTWPGMTLGNKIFPLTFGLPLSMIWIATCVVLSFLVLVFLDFMEGRARDAGDGSSAGATGSSGSQGSGPREGSA